MQYHCRSTFLVVLGMVFSAACQPIPLQEVTSEPVAATPEMTGAYATPTISPTLTTEEQIALTQAVAYLGEKAADLEFEYIKHDTADLVNAYHLYFRQVYQGLSVLSGGISVFVENNGNIWSSESYYPDVYLADVTPSVSLDEAVSIGAQSVGIPGAYTVEPGAQLVIYPAGLSGDPNRVYVLAWLFSLDTDCPRGVWGLIVNAMDGSVLSRQNGLESVKPINSPCATPILLPTVTPAPYTPRPTATPLGYPPPASTTEAPPTAEATSTPVGYPPIGTETATVSTEVVILTGTASP